MDNDQPLIDRARQGDGDAFGQLVRRYQDRLFTSLVHLTGQPDEAEDVAQEAFVQAYLKLGSFRGRSRFYTWLYRIAFRCAARRHRQRRPQVSGSAAEAPESDPVDVGEAPAERLLRQERALQIRAALDRLKNEYRTVLVLREIEEFDYETIARLLEISIGTVRSRLNRARAALRQQLQER